MKIKIKLDKKDKNQKNLWKHKDDYELKIYAINNKSYLFIVFSI